MNFIRLALILSALSSSVSWGACTIKLKLNVLKNVNVYQCDDGSISHQQPLNSYYEGLCGPTAAANAFYAFCQKNIVDPLFLSPKYFWDLTPGERPDVLKNGLNRMFSNNAKCIKGYWRYYYVTNRWEYLNSLYYEVRRGHGSMTRLQANGSSSVRSPVLALVSSGTNLHWVTVIDVLGYKPGAGTPDYRQKECRVVYNDSGSQSSKDCASFVKVANQVDDAWYTDIILSPYTHLVFDPVK